VWLIGAVVCLLAADRGSSCSLTRAMDGCMVCCGISRLFMPISCNLRDCKAFLVTSPSHVSSTKASTVLYFFGYADYLHWSNLTTKKVTFWVSQFCHLHQSKNTNKFWQNFLERLGFAKRGNWLNFSGDLDVLGRFGVTIQYFYYYGIAAVLSFSSATTILSRGLRI